MQAKNRFDMLKITLDAFYRHFDLKRTIVFDPVELPHRYTDPRDQETSGFIASCLSYGRVDLFKPVIGKILRAASTGPYEYFFNFHVRRDAQFAGGISYRMNTARDITAFLHLLSVFLRQNRSLGEFFRHNFKKEDPNVINVLSAFVKVFYAGDTSPVYGQNIRPAGLLQLLPSPDKGSTCKRSHMFLRWMVRAGDGIDFGLWTFIPRDKLIIPLDTHIARIARHLGLTKRKTLNIKTAMDITNSLKRFDPDDPVKYDFALCHLGISGKCPSKRSALSCVSCSFKNVCVP